MKTVEIDIDNTSSPKALAEEFKSRDLQKGDRLRLLFSKNDTEFFKLALAIVALIAINRLLEARTDYSARLLKHIYDAKKINDIEKEIKNEYDIDLAIDYKEDTEQQNWRSFSQSKLAKAYGDVEPEYTANMVREPNPEYKK